MNDILQALIIFVLKFVLTVIGFVMAVFGTNVIAKVLFGYHGLGFWHTVSISTSLALIVWGIYFVKNTIEVEV